MNSNLPKDARHLLHVLAVLADSEDGTGWHGQETIARAMGCSARHVRALLRDLERENDSGVRIERRPRFHTDGRGRTSDSWRLVGKNLPAQVLLTNRNTVPPEQPSAGTPSATNRNATTDQPEHRSGDLRSDLRSDRRSNNKARASSSKAKRKRNATEMPADWQPTEAHHAFASKHGIGLTLEAAAFDAHHKSKGSRFLSWDAAFTTWLCNQVRWKKPTGPRRVPAPQETPDEATFDADAERRANELLGAGKVVAEIVPIRRASET